MNKTATMLMCSFAATALFVAGGAFAQTTPMKSGEPMKGGAMASSDVKMSHKQTKMMKKCMAMDHEKMMANKTCEAMADKHPDMMKSDGMTKK